jgi:hypothetical protein
VPWMLAAPKISPNTHFEPLHSLVECLPYEQWKQQTLSRGFSCWREVLSREVVRFDAWQKGSCNLWEVRPCNMTNNTTVVEEALALPNPVLYDQGWRVKTMPSYKSSPFQRIVSKQQGLRMELKVSAGELWHPNSKRFIGHIWAYEMPSINLNGLIELKQK